MQIQALPEIPLSHMEFGYSKCGTIKSVTVLSANSLLGASLKESNIVKGLQYHREIFILCSTTFHLHNTGDNLQTYMYMGMKSHVFIACDIPNPNFHMQC